MCEVTRVVTEEFLLQLSQEPEYSWATFKLEVPLGPAPSSWPNYVHFNLADIT
jgi:hypothetical protein